MLLSGTIDVVRGIQPNRTREASITERKIVREAKRTRRRTNPSLESLATPIRSSAEPHLASLACFCYSLSSLPFFRLPYDPSLLLFGSKHPPSKIQPSFPVLPNFGKNHFFIPLYYCQPFCPQNTSRSDFSTGVVQHIEVAIICRTSHLR